MEMVIQKFIWNYKEAHIAKTIVIKNNKTGELPFPDFKTYYKVIRQCNIGMRIGTGQGN